MLSVNIDTVVLLIGIIGGRGRILQLSERLLAAVVPSEQHPNRVLSHPPNVLLFKVVFTDDKLVSNVLEGSLIG